MNGWQADPEGIMNLASQIRNTYKKKIIKPYNPLNNTIYDFCKPL